MTNAGDSHFFDAATVDGLEMLCAGDEDGSNQVAKTLKQVSGSEGDRRGKRGRWEGEKGMKGERGEWERESPLIRLFLVHTLTPSHLHLHTCASLVRG